jgi:hypothetical protein
MKYTVEVEDLTTGSSLGNFLLFARFDKETNLDALWYSKDNKFYCGRWEINFFIAGEKLKPVETTFEPLTQTTKYNNSSRDVIALKKSFLPFVRIENLEVMMEKLPNLFYVISLENRTGEEVEIKISHSIILPAVNSPYFTKQPPDDEKIKKFNLEVSKRILRFEPIDLNEDKREIKSNFVFDELDFDGERLRCVQSVKVNPNETKDVLLAFSIGRFEIGELGKFYDEIFKFSLSEMEKILKTASIFTPNKTINNGVKWAKVNMCRVEHLYKTGFAFTNDPPQDIVVMRDLAWFILGSDYVTPKFSHELANFALKYGIHPNGKVTEYVHANELNPKLYDYNLNINDDTPLLIWAVYHHINLCQEHDILSEYEMLKKIADYILTQVNDELVYSRTEGQGVYGITSWRNIIDGYNLSGYVSEINSECIFSLELVSKIADSLCKKIDALKYKNHADALRDAFMRKLISEVTNLPLLNIDPNGVKHHDITGDLVFPLLFSVVDDEVAKRIADRLIQPDLWTEFGMRTVSPTEKNYDPEVAYQLLGGIWPNLTAWVGYAVRKFYPEKVAEAMINIFKLIESQKPAKYQNLVPGQFPERLHGVDGSSKGMTLSPWMPPTYIWLAVEGLLGFSFEFDKVKFEPSLPPNWKWIAIENLNFKGRLIDAFMFEGKLYISGVDDVLYEGEVIKVEKLHLNAQIVGNGNAFVFAFEMLNNGSKYVFIATDEGFIGEILIEDRKIEVDLKKEEGKILKI